MSFSFRNLFRKDEIGEFETSSLTNIHSQQFQQPQEFRQPHAHTGVNQSGYHQQGNPGAGYRAHPQDPAAATPPSAGDPFASPFQQGGQAPPAGNLPLPTSKPAPFPLGSGNAAGQSAGSEVPPAQTSLEQAAGTGAIFQQQIAPAQGGAAQQGAGAAPEFPGAAGSPAVVAGQEPSGWEAGGGSPFSAAGQSGAGGAPASPFSSVEAPPSGPPFQDQAAQQAPFQDPAVGVEPQAAAFSEAQPPVYAPNFFPPAGDSLPPAGTAAVETAQGESVPQESRAAENSANQPAADSSLGWGGPRDPNEASPAAPFEPMQGQEMEAHTAPVSSADELLPGELDPPSSQGETLEEAPPAVESFDHSAAEAAADGTDERVELNLSAILTGVPDEVLGFNASQVPTTITTQVSLGLIKAQLAAGCVKVTVDQVMQGCDPAYQPAFARANLTHEVVLPLQEIFHNLPDDAVEEGEQVEAAESESSASGGAPGEEFLAVATGVPQAYGSDDEKVFSALFEEGIAAAESVGGEPEPLESLEAVELPPAAAASSDGLTSADLGTAPPRPADFPPEQSDAEIADVELSDIEPASEADPAGGANEAAADTAPVEEEAAAAEAVTENFVSEAPAGEEEEASSDYEFGVEENVGEGALNSILMTEEELSFQRVAELASKLPGIGACVVLSADGKLLGGNLPLNVEAGNFGSLAPRLYRNFQELSIEMGLGNAEAFTVHTDKGAVSFFKGFSLCLSVLHSRRDFVPGVRDKLLAIANELKQLDR